MVAENIMKAGIQKALFDRGGFKYHGRVKQVAEGLRDAGLKV
jgi:large subunit ribosomal protein L18